MSEQIVTAAIVPRSFDQLRDAIVGRRKALPKMLALIAVYVLANPDEIAFGTVESVANGAQVQPSALVHFAQTFGYQRLSDLQTVFRDRLRKRAPTYAARLAEIGSNGYSTVEQGQDPRNDHLTLADRRGAMTSRGTTGF